MGGKLSDFRVLRKEPYRDFVEFISDVLQNVSRSIYGGFEKTDHDCSGRFEPFGFLSQAVDENTKRGWVRVPQGAQSRGSQDEGGRHHSGGGAGGHAHHANRHDSRLALTVDLTAAFDFAHF